MREVLPRSWSAGRRPERWAQLPGPIGRRRRLRHRPWPDERCPRRPGRAHRSCAGRRPVGRARPGDAGVWPGGTVRDRHAHGRRRADPRGRNRLDHAQARPLGRPAAARGSGHRRRRARQGDRGRERGSLLGHSRRRRQLRDRDRVRVRSRSVGPNRARRADLLGDGGLAGGAALLPRLGRRRAGRADDDRGAPEGAAASVRSGGAARQAGCDGHPLLGRRGGGRREVRPADEGVRQSGR